jgi:site-specific recombinase XerC
MKINSLPPVRLPAEDAGALAESWLLRLRSERKSPRTVASYAEGLRQYIEFGAVAGEVPLDLDTLARFVNSILDKGFSPSTARLRQLAVRRWSEWLASDAEREIPYNPLLGAKLPRLDEKIIPELNEDEIKRLLKTCGPSFAGRRDEAIIRLMLEAGCRSDEVANMNLTDIDLARGLAVVRKAKGGKARTVPFGPATGAAIDRYLRLRRRHVLADETALWLGERRKRFGNAALYKSLKLKGKAAGIADFHPHVLRHTFAGRWLGAGGSEGGLMSVAGWSRREMIDRYTRQTNERRAHEEARRLSLGDV